LEAILGGLRAEGKDLDHLTPEDLAPVDELHIRGREATVELADLACASPGMKVLDVGCGLGGSSRYLAAERRCDVTGIDLTPEYCDIAIELSKRTGLERLTHFRCGSALEMPFGDGIFDLAWTQHAQMNIQDKRGLYAQIFRVLRPDGKFVFHDVLAGPGGMPYYPTHWAEDPSISYLIAPGDLRKLLEETGFEVAEWRDKTEISRDWFLAAIQKLAEGPKPNLGPHLLIGETGPAKVQNISRNLTEQRISIFQGVLLKASN
jgi:ubiquinone/menaquinone biosynthesis C-methylase UbiE